MTDLITAAIIGITTLGLYLAEKYPGPKIIVPDSLAMRFIEQKNAYFESLLPKGKTGLFFRTGEGEHYKLLHEESSDDPTQVLAVRLPDGRIWDIYGRAYRGTAEYEAGMKEYQERPRARGAIE